MSLHSRQFDLVVVDHAEEKERDTPALPNENADVFAHYQGNLFKAKQRI